MNCLTTKENNMDDTHMLIVDEVTPEVVPEVPVEAVEHESVIEHKERKPRFVVGAQCAITTEDGVTTPFRIKSINFMKGELRLKRFITID